MPWRGLVNDAHTNQHGIEVTVRRGECSFQRPPGHENMLQIKPYGDCDPAPRDCELGSMIVRGCGFILLLEMERICATTYSLTNLDPCRASRTYRMNLESFRPALRLPATKAQGKSARHLTMSFVADHAGEKAFEPADELVRCAEYLACVQHRMTRNWVYTVTHNTT